MNSDNTYYRCTYRQRCPLAQKFSRSDRSTWIRKLPNGSFDPPCPLKEERPQCQNELESFQGQSASLGRYLGLVVIAVVVLCAMYLGMARLIGWPPFVQERSAQEILERVLGTPKRP